MIARTFTRLLLAALLLAAPASAAHAAAAPKPAPSLTLRTARAPVALDSLRGKVVIVDFWASWCGPCHQSFPWLDGLQKRYRDQGLVVVGVNLDKTAEAADAFLARNPVTFTIAYDAAGRAAEAFGVQAMPTTVLIGRDGTIRTVHAGFDARKTAPFEAALGEALQP